MKTVCVSYSILKSFEVPDDATNMEIYDVFTDYAKKHGFYD